MDIFTNIMLIALLLGIFLALVRITNSLEDLNVLKARHNQLLRESIVVAEEVKGFLKSKGKG